MPPDSPRDSSDGTAPADSLVGRRLGPYVIQSLLGAGGMGRVYRAQDTKLGRSVAIKVLPEAFVTDPERLARFGLEARVLASLNHPNIAAIYGFEHSDNLQGLILEFVEGETLAERLHAGPLPADQALIIARQIADGLDAAHQKGIIHRDLKPANAIIQSGRHSDSVKVKILELRTREGLASGRHRPHPRGDGHLRGHARWCGNGYGRVHEPRADPRAGARQAD